MFAPPWTWMYKSLLAVRDVVQVSRSPRLDPFDSAGNNIAAGHLKTCLCQSAVPGFLDSNPVAKKVVDCVGKDGAHDYFAGLVSGKKPPS